MLPFIAAGFPNVAAVSAPAATLQAVLLNHRNR
jgi:hypothetical protein